MPSLADTLKSTRFPSTSTTSAVVHTSWPTGVAAKVLYTYRSADGAFTCIQKRSYGIELSVFYHQNYRGRREHLAPARLHSRANLRSVARSALVVHRSL